MWRGRLRALGVVAVLAGALVACTPQGSPPRAVYATMASEPGDYIGWGPVQAPGADARARVFHPGNARFEVEATAARMSVTGERVSVIGLVGDADRFAFEFAAPKGSQLRTGHYGDVQRLWNTRRPAAAGLDVYGDGRGCNMLSGSFDVLELGRGPGGAIESFWATYEQHCEGAVPALVGEVRVFAPGARTEPIVAPTSMRFPSVYPGLPGTPLPLAVVAGAQQLRPGAVALGGAHARSFEVVRNECSGRVLAPAAQCIIWLRVAASRPGPHVARLILKDASGANLRTVALSAGAIPGRTHARLSSDAGLFRLEEPVTDDVGPGHALIVVGGGEDRLSALVQTDQGSRWRVSVAGRPGEAIRNGDYADAVYLSSVRGDHPGISVSHGQWTCSDVRGSFSISGLVRSPVTGLPEQARIDYLAGCGDLPFVAAGTIEYRMPKGDVTPPASVGGVRITATDSGASISWGTPAETVRVIARVHPGTPVDTSPLAGRLAFAVSGATTGTVGGLNPGHYTVVLYAMDRAGNVSPGVRVAFRVPVSA
jgi:hypothetical protein